MFFKTLNRSPLLTRRPSADLYLDFSLSHPFAGFERKPAFRWIAEYNLVIIMKMYQGSCYATSLIISLDMYSFRYPLDVARRRMQLGAALPDADKHL